MSIQEILWVCSMPLAAYLMFLCLREGFPADMKTYYFRYDVVLSVILSVGGPITIGVALVFIGLIRLARLR